MANQDDLFRSYNPLVKSGALFVKIDYISQSPISIRPVWIIGDLEVFHDWILSPLRKSNWEINPKKSSVFRHYKSTLLSSHAQSLTVVRNQKLDIQFDILPIPSLGWPTSIAQGNQDYCLNFLFRESFRDSGNFERSLDLLIDFLKGFSGIRFLYVKLLKPDFQVGDNLMRTGFEKLNLLNVYGRTIPLYRISLLRPTDSSGLI
jgi:hypothetical protein